MFNHKEKLIVINDSIIEGTTRKGEDFCKGHFHFYLQAANSADPIYLFTSKRYSPSIARFMAKEGVKLSNNSYSITLGQFYSHRHRYDHNPVLTTLFNYHIPKWLNYVRKYELDRPEPVVAIPIKTSDCYTHFYDEEDRAA